MKTESTELCNAFFYQNPTKLGERVNALGQTCEFFEHPLRGDEAPVYVTINGVLANTRAFDMGDFYDGSDYMPELHEGRIDCSFIFEKEKKQQKTSAEVSDFHIEFDVAATLADGTKLVEADHAYAESFNECMRQLAAELTKARTKMKLEMAKAYEAGCKHGYEAGIEGAQIIIENFAEESADDYMNQWQLARRNATNG